MSSEAPKKPLSKLQRRIQAGLAGSASSSAAVQPKTSTGESGPMEIVETNLGVDSSTTSLTRDFPFLPTPSSLYAQPSNFANALPRPAPRANKNQFFSLSKEIFLQPCEPNAFLGPSPDDEVLIARQGSSLGASLRRT
ncbi:hypothetical protein MJO28_004074 [Puccinia striiformis f. sp. tritici]|uniref:Uncharacterized protein n=3 Tax=Puccinia striiformis TaxID=27350 RepID=A0A2S4UFG0_9BASI|nr:hypothetical protein Pst134EA_007307 [Puccinia striiformis f. sp. tritici]KAI9617033.1 hypothetical protein H4Q26_010671 [Puccinia striiformis f. sp. tritici PST-130]KNF01285.1 hypothetical protein PSTG_05382 [Puccinia striiformis f. sp. tritici PST-78]POV95926.1 hypothetical protein PSTT_15944 [Puccinia striiformis]KAH9460271.1 hypothetical protein Pst134EB_008452 [Puccinia striiformis f. sp. tritici]KAH9470044.1 hypothetical protein Pst134EA_007307 [Puccinia striiformis f. sp. tritici]